MASGKSFVREGIPELNALVGTGKLRGSVIVDQVYAKYQHERLDLRHPRGGTARYLAIPLFTHYRSYLQKLAEAVLTGELVDTMAYCMGLLNQAMTPQAPVRDNNLRRSGSTRVYDNGRLVRMRTAHQRRLSEQELRAVRRRGRRSR